jgi:hypothetical protein
MAYYSALYDVGRYDESYYNKLYKELNASSRIAITLKKINDRISNQESYYKFNNNFYDTKNARDGTFFSDISQTAQKIGYVSGKFDRAIQLPGVVLTTSVLNGSTALPFGQQGSYERIAQSFVASVDANGYLHHIKFRRMANTGTVTTGTQYIAIFPDDNGVPGASAIGSASWNISTWGQWSSAQDSTLRFPTQFQGNLTPGQTYWIVVYRNAVDVNNYLNVAYDPSGTSGTLKIYDGSSWNTISGSLRFAVGYSDYGIITNPVELPPTSFSVSWWMKKTNTDYECILSSSVNAGSGQIEINGNAIRFESRTNNVFNPPNYATGIDVSDGQWHHFVYTSGTTSTKLYVDNILRSSFTQNTDTANQVYKYIGAFQSAPNGNYGLGLTGSIDELRFFSKELTVQEIEQLFYIEHFAKARIQKKLTTTKTGTASLKITKDYVGTSRLIVNKRTTEQGTSRIRKTFTTKKYGNANIEVPFQELSEEFINNSNNWNLVNGVQIVETATSGSQQPPITSYVPGVLQTTSNLRTSEYAQYEMKRVSNKYVISYRVWVESTGFAPVMYIYLADGTYIYVKHGFRIDGSLNNYASIQYSDKFESITSLSSTDGTTNKWLRGVIIIDYATQTITQRDRLDDIADSTTTFSSNRTIEFNSVSKIKSIRLSRWSTGQVFFDNINIALLDGSSLIKYKEGKGILFIRRFLQYQGNANLLREWYYEGNSRILKHQIFNSQSESRILKTLTKEIEGTSNLLKTISKNYSTNSRLLINYTKSKVSDSILFFNRTSTKIANSLIRIRYTKQKDSLARLAVPFAYTTEGISRILVPIKQEEEGTSRIAVSFTKNKTGKSMIQLQNIPFYFGNSRLVKTFNEEYLGTSILFFNRQFTKDSESRLLKTINKQTEGISRLLVNFIKQKDSDAILSFNRTKEIESDSRLKVKLNKTNDATSRLLISNIKTKQAKSVIDISGFVGSSGTARLVINNIVDKYSNSRLLKRFVKLPESNSRIELNQIKTKQGNSRIEMLGKAKSVLGKSRLFITGVGPRDSVGRLRVNFDKTKTGNSNIVLGFVSNETGNARISINVGKTKQSNARIQKEFNLEKLGNACTGYVSKVVSFGKARLKVFGLLFSKNANSSLVLNIRKDYTSKAMIQVPGYGTSEGWRELVSAENDKPSVIIGLTKPEITVAEWW